MHATVDRTCIFCGRTFQATRAKFCSTTCNNAHRALHNGTCSADDCSNGVTARGLCRTHYGQQNPNHRRMIDYPCDGCGKVVRKEASRLNRYPTLYCTPKCKTATEWRDLWKIRKAVVIYDPAIARANKNRPTRKTASTAPERTFRCGNCAVCGEGFVTRQYQDATCSDRICTETYRMDKKHRRRARRRSAYRAPVSRIAIYARDNHTCQLCGDPLDMEAKAPRPQSPSIDHTIPLARGGTHEPGNVQAAHFLCNSRKSDRLDWSALAA